MKPCIKPLECLTNVGHLYSTPQQSKNPLRPFLESYKTHIMWPPLQRSQAPVLQFADIYKFTCANETSQEHSCASTPCTRASHHPPCNHTAPQAVVP